jgi:hypothetical protein
MDSTTALGTVSTWLDSSPGVRPPDNLTAALLTVAEDSLAREVAVFSTLREFCPDGPPWTVTEDEQARFEQRRDRLAQELLDFLRSERSQTPQEYADEISQHLLTAAVEHRQKASQRAGRLLDDICQECRRRLARGVFGAYFRPPHDPERHHKELWGRLLFFVASDSLVPEALRRFRNLEKRLEKVGYRREDLVGQLVEIALTRRPPEYRGVGETIAWFVKEAAFAWIKLVRETIPTLPGRDDDPTWSQIAARPPQRAEDIPDTWVGCLEYFSPHTADAARLFLLRLVRGAFRGPFDPADIGWGAVRDLLAQRDRFSPEQAERLRAAGGDTALVVAAFDLAQALAGTRDALLLEARSAVGERGGSADEWSVELLASYYFLALLPPDEAYPTYPISLEEFQRQEITRTQRGNAAWFWLVDFLRHGYHLTKAVRSPVDTEWADVVRLLGSIDDLIAAHRLIRVTRLPPDVCWQRLHEEAAARAKGINEAALRQFHRRHASLFRPA